MSRYDFWTHGVNTIVQFPERAKSISHSGGGTVLEQQGSPENVNWLHIPIPSPTVLDSLEVSLHYVRVRGTINNKAVIEEVQLLVDGESKTTDVGLTISGTKLDQFKFGNTIAPIKGGLVISVRVKFSTGGKVTIRGAGARFEHLPIPV